MSAKSKIEWCDSSWSPVTGCTPVSIGCEKCYAKRMAGRFPHLHGVSKLSNSLKPESFREIIYHIDRLDIPLHWRKPKRIFVCSMGDFFHPDVSLDWIDEIFDVIKKCPQHTFMILTKRPENASKLNVWPENVWLGVTAENQEMADKRIPILLQIPAAVRFVSVEPMLGLVILNECLANKNGDCEPNLDDFCNGCFHDIPIKNLDWVICGPETGPGARPMNLDWARSLRNQCVAADVPFFYKRGELDGKLWHQFPKRKA